MRWSPVLSLLCHWVSASQFEVCIISKIHEFLEQRKVAYDRLAENPNQVESAESVDFTAARGGYKPRKVAYDRLAENPSQVESAESVDFTAARGGYKPRKVAYDRLAENPSQVESVKEVDFTAARGGYKRE